MNIITPSIEAKESPNKALIIGDSFLDTLHQTNDIASNNFIKHLLYEAFDMKKGSKFDTIIDTFLHSKSNVVRNIKEVIGLYFIVQYDYDTASKQTIDSKGGDKFVEIGKFFGEQYGIGALHKDIKELPHNIIERLNNQLITRIRENKALWHALDATTKDVQIVLTLKDDFFSINTPLGGRKIMPNIIEHHRYHTWGLLEKDTQFQSLHNLLIEPKTGFDIFTIINRLKQKKIYDDVIDFHEQITGLGYHPDSKKTYGLAPIYDKATGEYTFGFKKYFEKRAHKREDFCVTYLYRHTQKKEVVAKEKSAVSGLASPYSSHMDTDALFTDIMRIYKKIILTQKNKKTGSYDTDIVDTIYDHISDDNHKKILSFYQVKADIVGVPHQYGQKVLLEGTDIYAILSTTASQKHGDSVTISLYDRYDILPISCITYIRKGDIVIIDDNQHPYKDMIYKHVKRLVEDKQHILQGLSPIQQDIMIDGCVKSITKVLFGYGDTKDPERLDYHTRVLTNIINKYFTLSGSQLQESDKAPYIDLPHYPLQSGNLNNLLQDIQDKKYRTTHTSFLKDTIAQRVSHQSYKEPSLASFDIAAYRYNQGYKKQIGATQQDIVALLKDKQHDDIYNTTIAQIVIQRLYTFQDNKIEDKKRYIINNAEELRTAVALHTQKDAIIQHLYDFIPYAQEKESTLLSQYKADEAKYTDIDKKFLPQKRHVVDTKLLIEAIHYITDAGQVTAKPSSGKIINTASLIKYIDELRTGAIFEQHIQTITNSDYAHLFLQLSEKEKSYYIAWLHKTGHIIPYMEALQAHNHKQLYIDIGTLWYKNVGKKEVDTLTSNIDYLTPRAMIDENGTLRESEMNDDKKGKKIALEKNQLYIFFYAHFITPGNVFLETIPTLQKTITALQTAYSSYIHEQKLVDMRTSAYENMLQEAYKKDFFNTIDTNTITL